MKEERKEAIGWMVFSLVWIGIAVVLFISQAHSRLYDVIDRVLGNGAIANLVNIPVSLFWVVFYAGGFLMFRAAAKQFITGQKGEAQTGTAPAPHGQDEKVLASLFAKRDVLFASEQDLEGRLLLTDKRLRYIGLSTHKVLLSLRPAEILSLTSVKSKIKVTFIDAKRKKRTQGYKLLTTVSNTAEVSTFHDPISYGYPTPIPEFQAALTRWLSWKTPPTDNALAAMAQQSDVSSAPFDERR